MIDDNSPILVSVKCMAYNQAHYISRCLDGIIMQNVNFKYEVLVHDDASDDGTTEIIQQYSKKNPKLIKPIIETENQYKKGKGAHHSKIDTQIRGKYIAFCEGDDYWIDPNKLQSQVDVLEEDPDIGMVYTMCKYYYQASKTFSDKGIGGPHVLYNQLIYRNTIPTMTVVCRAEMYFKYFAEIKPYDRNWVAGDYPMWLWFSKNSRIFFINKVTAVYRYLGNSASHSPDLERLLKFKMGIIDIVEYYSDYYKEGPSKQELEKMRLKERMKSYALVRNCPGFCKCWFQLLKTDVKQALFTKQLYAYVLFFLSKTLRDKHI